MTHPCFHARTSVKRWGGEEKDYLAIHDWLDSSKSALCDFRHRALRHHSFGVFEAEQHFGHSIINSAGREVPVRYIAEQHIKEDCGGIVPSLADWLSRIPSESWMSRGYADSALEPSAGSAPSLTDGLASVTTGLGDAR